MLRPTTSLSLRLLPTLPSASATVPSCSFHTSTASQALSGSERMAALIASLPERLKVTQTGPLPPSAWEIPPEANPASSRNKPQGFSQAVKSASENIGAGAAVRSEAYARTNGDRARRVRNGNDDAGGEGQNSVRKRRPQTSEGGAASRRYERRDNQAQPSDGAASANAGAQRYSRPREGQTQNGDRGSRSTSTPYSGNPSTSSGTDRPGRPARTSKREWEMVEGKARSSDDGYLAAQKVQAAVIDTRTDDAFAKLGGVSVSKWDGGKSKRMETLLQKSKSYTSLVPTLKFSPSPISTSQSSKSAQEHALRQADWLLARNVWVGVRQRGRAMKFMKERLSL